MRVAAALCAERGRFLFEARPDLFPEGRLSDVETAVWGLYYADRAARDRARGAVK